MNIYGKLQLVALVVEFFFLGAVLLSDNHTKTWPMTGVLVSMIVVLVLGVVSVMEGVS